MSFSVTLLGATGLIGRHCLQFLLEEEACSKLTTITRRELDTSSLSNTEKLNAVVTSLDQLKASKEMFNADILICCLGTTIKTAGSKAAFRKVDYDYVCQAAEIAKQQGCTRMIVISAVGADSKSPFFYNKVKGEMEETLTALQFDSLHIIRPSLLLGERDEKRLAEDLSKPFSRAFSPLLIGHLKRYRPVDGSDVAQKVVDLCKEKGTGVHITYPTL